VILTSPRLPANSATGLSRGRRYLSELGDTPQQIPAGLSFSMSGSLLDHRHWRLLPSADQYTSDAYHELLIRWFQFGAFSPIFRVHGYQSETEMWKYGPRSKES